MSALTDAIEEVVKAAIAPIAEQLKAMQKTLQKVEDQEVNTKELDKEVARALDEKFERFVIKLGHVANVPLNEV